MTDNFTFEKTFQRKLIYIFAIDDEAHKGFLKIGDATVKSDLPPEDLVPSCSDLNKSAKKRINSYAGTVGVEPKLLYTELAIKEEVDDDTSEIVLKSFRDHEVHKVLKNSGIKSVQINNTTGKEWFKVDLETAKNAIKAVKEGRKTLSGNEITTGKTPILFRPEQEKAINDTLKNYKHNNHMLWNAKMRFGKTVCALEVVKQLNKVGVKRTIIATHRPVVNEGWHEDFQKIFYDRNDYFYITKDSKEDIKKLEKEDKNFIYFASIQDLRGSDSVGGKFDKNLDVFEMKWDMVIIDEAHEGTTTKLGQDVKELLITNGHTKLLELSGTPFNIISKYNQGEVYTWDYMKEQTAKKNWDIEHFGDSNPYEELPQMKIFTYDLGESLGLDRYNEIEDKAFNFKEFFRTWMENDKKKPQSSKVGDFVHEQDIISFLNLISKENKNNNYPYACEEYRELFKHSLWMLPGVKEAKALSTLLKKHSVFGNGQFEIVNIAGDGDEEDNSQEALTKVKTAIKNGLKNDTYTITLSCGRLTTGVTIPEWTAVMMLSGSYSTSAANYLQTIFRVQSPANINGMRKEYCYVFDFAPDRTLKMVADAVQLSTKAGKANDADRKIMGEFLNFCPVISFSGTQMIRYDEAKLLQQLKRAYAERAVKSGFEDNSLYNDTLLYLDDLAMEKFNGLKKIVGSSKPTKKTNEFTVNDQGLTNEEREELERIKSKPKRERTPEEEEKLKKDKEQKDKKQKAISILRAISVRIPLLVYGGNSNKDIEKIEDLLDVDDDSWNEFMPKGVTKELFKDFIKYYDVDVFSAACKKIRNIVKYADTLTPTERVIEISKLFSYFKNPDKETVLTPWRVVNMHLGDTLGGYCFFDENYDEEKPLETPRFIDHGEVTVQTLGNKDAQILEINSKTGLYPLYVTYSIFRAKCSDVDKMEKEEQDKIWDDVVKNNVYVICKTPMAKSITKRTLVGFRNVKINAHYFEDLINTIQNKSKQFVDRITNPSYWNKKDRKEMKFDAVVGNPPYQIVDGGGTGDSAKPVYQLFVNVAINMCPHYVSMIMPSRWTKGGKGLDDFRNFIMEDTRMVYLYDYANAKECFPSVHIDSGICYFLWNEEYDDLCNYIYKPENEEKIISRRYLKSNLSETIIRDYRQISILENVNKFKEIKFNTIVSSRKPYGIATDLFNRPSNYPQMELSLEKKKNFIKIYGVKGKKGGAKRIEGYIQPKSILCNKENVNKYKLFFSYAYSTNATNPPEIIVGSPNEIATETFLEIGAFNNKFECLNCLTYMKTKFFRALLFFNRIQKNASNRTFELIPMQDYTNNSDIDWSQSISDIDKQLYIKYNLSENEINYIESMIKPME